MALGQLHLTPEGPARCSADPSKPGARGCPFEASGHFDSPGEAEAAFGAAMGGSFSKRPLRVPELLVEEQAVLDEYLEFVAEEELEFPNNSSAMAEEDYVSLALLRENPELLANNCYSASSELAEYWAQNVGDASVLSVHYEDDHSHHAMVIGSDPQGVVVDFTAAQYDESLPVPLVLRRERWEELIADRVARKHGISIKKVFLEGAG